MSTTVRLTVTSSRGVLDVLVHIEERDDLGRRALLYRAVPAMAPEGDFFEARLVVVAQTIWQVVALAAHRPELRGVGVAPALLLDARTRTGGTVRSSSNLPAAKVLPNEYRTRSATETWERMRARGCATYDATVDRYEVT